MTAQKKTMNTVKELYRIGRGPSSSHTMGPERACRYFRSRTPLADSYKVILYGSLADTGEGHGTSRAITDELMPVPVVIEKNKEKIELPHPNTLEMYAYKDGDEIECRNYACRT